MIGSIALITAAASIVLTQDMESEAEGNPLPPLAPIVPHVVPTIPTKKGESFLSDRYEVIKDQWVVLHIIPDETIKNKKIEQLTRAMADMFKKRVDRQHIEFSRLRVRIEEPARFSFRIHITKDSVNFFLAIPEKWKSYVQQKIYSVWDKATVIEATWEPVFDASTTHACTMNLRRHNIMSLDTTADDLKPIYSILNVADSMKDGDQAMIEILAEPTNKNTWEFDATRAYAGFKKGNIPKRLEYTWRAAGRFVLESIAGLLREIFTEVSSLMSPEKKKKNGEDEYNSDPDIQLISLRGLSQSSKVKCSTPTFKSWIRVLAQSSDRDSAIFNCKSLAASFRDMSGDNELERSDVMQARVKHFLSAVNRRQAHGFMGISNDMLSCHEIAKMMQLPDKQMQEDFPQIAKITKKQVSLPHTLYAQKNGLPLGYVTEKGIRRLASLPTDDHNIFCIPHVGFGKMGTGKTTQAEHTAVSSIELGYSVFMVDTADGRGIDNARNALPEGFPDDHIIDLDFGNKRFPIPTNLSDIALVSQSEHDDELSRREAANKLKDALVHFIKNISAYDTPLTDRMEEFIGAAGRAVLRNPENTILELALALSSPEYVKQLLEDPEIQMNYQIVETLSRLFGKGDSKQKVEPILSRINLLLNNDFSANLFMQRNKPGDQMVNFRKWADGDDFPYFVGIRVSKDDWGPNETNRITAFILQKWYLAILSRANIPQEQRKPCLLIWDEPHTAIEASGHILENMAVELRKYRGRPVFFAHGPRQFGKHWGALTTGGYTLSVYRTKEPTTMFDLKHEIDPFTPEEALKQLPDRFWAINKISVNGVSDVPAFMAEMCPPPKFVKDRAYRRKECSEFYGRSYLEVEKDIYERRQRILDLDATGDAEPMMRATKPRGGRF